MWQTVKTGVQYKHDYLYPLFWCINYIIGRQLQIAK